MHAMMSFVTRQYAEFTVFTGSKCFGPISRKHTPCHSTLCASISRQRNKLAQRNKVQKEAHQMYFHAICLTQNRKCAPNGPFSQIRSHIVQVPMIMQSLYSICIYIFYIIHYITIVFIYMLLSGFSYTDGAGLAIIMQ